MTAYQRLEARFGVIADLGQAESILNWDRAVIMPAPAGEERARQLATLASLAHERLTDPATARDLDEAEKKPPADPWQMANLRQMRRLYTHASALPEKLVEALSMATARCEGLWREAKKASDWKAVEAPLALVLELTREKAAIKAQHLGVSPYDALLDLYDPGNTVAAIDPVFDDLAGFLKEFIPQVTARQRSEAPVPLPPVPVEKQKKMAQDMAARLGLDMTASRLDESAHPFCGGTSGDKRITTRYAPDDFLPAMMGVIHETGHALYDSGTPVQWRRQPVGDSMNMGMAIHESQSLICEMQLACSPAFCEFAAPLYRAAFDGTGPAFEPLNIFRHLTRVGSGFIRVDADEVTYPLHVILRYRLEKDMIAGRLAVRDLPQAWNEAFRGLFGVVPPDHARGCMQDIHWFEGYFGYFPTYALGAMTAAQLWQAAADAIPDLEARARLGDFVPLTRWLCDNVHAQGCLYSPAELVRRVTGRPLDPAVFRAHLTRRYLGDEAAKGRAA